MDCTKIKKGGDIMQALYKELVDAVEELNFYVYLKETNRPVEKGQVLKAKAHILKLVNRICGYILFHGRR